MKDILNKLKDKFLVIYLIINLLYILIGSYLSWNAYILEKIFSYGFIVLLGINLLIILILFLKKKYVKNKIDIFLLLIIIFACISTIFAYNQDKALFGGFLRYEGLFVICYYITILFLTSFVKKEDRKYVVYSILIFGFIQVSYAICQKLNLFGAHTKVKNGWRWATGFTGNRNFFGALMVICTCYSIGLFFKSKDRLAIGVYLFLIYLFSIGLFLSKSLGCVLGIIFVLILLFVYALKNKNIKKFLAVLIILIFNIVFLECNHLSGYIIDINEAKDEVKEVLSKKTNDNYVIGRLDLWKKTIEVTPKYLLHGVGIDSFSNIIDGRPIRTKDGYFDKAHNEYLQILVTMGIFSLISYLCLHFIIIKNGIKNAFKNKEIYLIFPVIGYLVQAQFNISVIEVAPLFYISLGLLVDREYHIDKDV